MPAAFFLRTAHNFFSGDTMSIFDVFTNGSLGSVIDTIAQQARNFTGTPDGGSILDTLGQKAKGAATSIRNSTPGGLGGLAGAGALGAVLGSVFSGNLLKGVALAGASAVAYNFYKKWAAGKKGEEQAPLNQSSDYGQMPAGWGDSSAAVPAKGVDPVAELVLRSMIYAARADGNIDATEQARIDEIMSSMLPGQNLSGVMERIKKEMIDPNKIAVATTSPEQAEDVYRLSCAVIDVDHFMEDSYLQSLARALGLGDSRKKQLEAEAEQAKRQLMASVPA